MALVRGSFSNLTNFKGTLLGKKIAKFKKTVIRREYSSLMSVQAKITEKLQSKFEPIHLDIVNESYKHNVPNGSETHFKVLVVSNVFEGVPLIEQHKMVNSALSDELKTNVHALAIKTMTESKWKVKQSEFTTPSCLGGSKNDKASVIHNK